MAFWLRCEDLVVAVVGPFASAADAAVHAEFCAARGDGADMVVLSDSAAAALRRDDPNLYVLTPAEDRALVLPD